MKNDYRDKALELSRISGDAYTALRDFLEKNPKLSGVVYLEYEDLLLKYKAAFTDWINFSEKHAK